jgi:hypothetical protein
MEPMYRFLSNCFFVSFATMMLTVATQTATATPVVDQAQLLANTGIPWPDDVPNGQSFTAGLSGQLTEVDFYSNGPNTGGTATLKLYSGDGLGGSVLGSINDTFGSTPPDSPISFDVSSLNISVSAGSIYTFDIAAFTGQQQVLADTSNPYAGGRQYDNPSYYGNNPSWDLTFRTFVNVPEPSSCLFLALGVIGLAARRRR